MIANNRFLLAAIASFAAFIAVGYLIPWPVFYAVVNIGLVIAAGLVMMQHLPEAWRVVVFKERLEGSPAAHLPVVGNFNIATGGVLAALAGLAMGTDFGPLIAETPFELIGRGLATAGLFLILLSPNVTSAGVRFRSGIWFYAAITVAAVIGGIFIYNAGIQRGHGVELTDDAHIPADHPRCPLDRQVWGSASGVYHDRYSPYRKQVVPARCFTSAREAEEKGFRAPG